MEAEENYILKYEMLSINLFSLKVSERVSVSHLNVRLLKLASYTIRQFDMYLPRSQDTLPSYPLLWVFFVDFSHSIRMNDMACDSTSVGVYSPW